MQEFGVIHIFWYMAMFTNMFFHKLIPFSVFSFPVFLVYWIVAVSCPACLPLPLYSPSRFPPVLEHGWFSLFISSDYFFLNLGAGHWSRLELQGLARSWNSA